MSRMSGRGGEEKIISKIGIRYRGMVRFFLSAYPSRETAMARARKALASAVRLNENPFDKKGQVPKEVRVYFFGDPRPGQRKRVPCFLNVLHTRLACLRAGDVVSMRWTTVESEKGDDRRVWCGVRVGATVLICGGITLHSDSDRVLREALHAVHMGFGIPFDCIENPSNHQFVCAESAIITAIEGKVAKTA